MKQNMKLKLITASLVLAFAAPSGWAGEREELETLKLTTLNLINMLVDQGVLTREKADTLVLQAEKTAVEKVAQQKKADAGVVRVAYVPETVKREMRDQIKQEVLAQARGERWGDPGSLPGWLSRISWEGDFRLRYQGDSYPSGNADPLELDYWYGFPSSTSTIGNSSEDRNRLRLQAHLGMQAKVSDAVTAGIRLATGNNQDAVSTNQTLGNTAQKYSVWVDRAYLKVDPYNWLSISGGRIANPWFGTDLVWDKDLNFEGIAASLRPKLSDTYTGFLTMGAFPLQDIAPTTNDKSASKWLYGVQGGMEWKGLSGSSAKIGLALYDYEHVEGIPDTAVGALDFDNTRPQFRQKGNSWFMTATDASPKLASRFREINLTASMDVATFDPVHVIVTADYVRNIGYDQNEILQRTGLSAPAPQVKGYQTQLTLGYPKIQKFNDWQAFVGYRYLQQDAVLDAFTDSDFHLGGTNAKGYFLGGSYGLDKNTWMSLRWLSSNQIDGPTLAIDTLQMDLNAKF
jgi:hypothetical protein